MPSKKMDLSKIFTTCRYKLSQSDFDKLSAIYDELYAGAVLILAKYNPCAIENGKCFRGNPCCDNCDYLSEEKGCTVKSLVCKLFLCQAARNKFPECSDALMVLEQIAEENHFLGYRLSKEDTFLWHEVSNK